MHTQSFFLCEVSSAAGEQINIINLSSRLSHHSSISCLAELFVFCEKVCHTETVPIDKHTHHPLNKTYYLS